MALMHCPECQQNVSTQATSCPHCGYPLRPQFDALRDDPDLVRLVERERKRRAFAPVSIILVAIFLLISLVAFAAQSQRSQHPTYHTCTDSSHWVTGTDGVPQNGSYMSSSLIPTSTPCP